MDTDSSFPDTPRYGTEELGIWTARIYFAVTGFGTSSGATSVGCRLSRCPLLVEFALATLKMLLMGGI
jgi:hypothetical protein